MVYYLISWVLKRVGGHAFFRFSLYPMFDEKKNKTKLDVNMNEKLS